jgi:hypothetical protein
MAERVEDGDPGRAGVFDEWLVERDGEVGRDEEGLLDAFRLNGSCL